jgi:hypothetical protein
MFEKKENKLSKNESELMEMARDKYINGYKKRSSNPSDFNTNIICLEELAQATRCWMTVAVPHIRKQKFAEHKAEKLNFSFFRDKAREEVFEERIIIESLEKKMLEGVETIKKEDLAKEPRIIDLKYEEDHKIEIIKGKVISKIDNELYTITFSDNYRLTLKDHKSESLAQAKVKFNEKMEALSTNLHAPRV